MDTVYFNENIKTNCLL